MRGTTKQKPELDNVTGTTTTSHIAKEFDQHQPLRRGDSGPCGSNTPTGGRRDETSAAPTSTNDLQSGACKLVNRIQLSFSAMILA